ncbi:MAG: bifunctional adenosylcobinamide kinase/adenosylcobinamide-phosphate guanylyltransferase [Deltaproteobacteria bacterium]|nr:MAG: bifunctional adenosylcobinamide kinase/adenosylcobinamide-phosphate guanylyltransferase [Deltaproteobacteria bacterium]
MAGRLALIGGGARSGKSAFALARATAAGPRRVYVATATAGDDEMRARIARHRAERGDAFVTVEAPRDVAAALRAAPPCDAVVVDCLTLWLANCLAAGAADADVLAEADDLIAAARGIPALVVVVTNEVGMGVVPPTPLGRRFRDLAGWVHQRVAAAADELYLAALGSVLRLRPAPIDLVDRARP